LLYFIVLMSGGKHLTGAGVVFTFRSLSIST